MPESVAGPVQSPGTGIRRPEHFATPSPILLDPHAGRPLCVSIPVRKKFSQGKPVSIVSPLLQREGEAATSVVARRANVQ
jgi:hypothetical protein